jgi:hypothetical protein
VADETQLVVAAGPGTAVSVRSVVRHPLQDVALLELELPAAGGFPSMTPIAFESREGVPITSDSAGELAGYGLDEAGQTNHRHFLIERVTDVSDEAVTVSGFGRSGACGGDSGGPLLMRAIDGSLTVAGVLTMGSESCVGQDMFVRTSAIQDWIVATVGAYRATTKACGTINTEGRCFEDRALWCDAGVLRGVACGPGTECGWCQCARTSSPREARSPSA